MKRFLGRLVSVHGNAKMARIQSAIAFGLVTLSHAHVAPVLLGLRNLMGYMVLQVVGFQVHHCDARMGAGSQWLSGLRKGGRTAHQRGRNQYPG